MTTIIYIKPNERFTFKEGDIVFKIYNESHDKEKVVKIKVKDFFEK